MSSVKVLVRMCCRTESCRFPLPHVSTLLHRPASVYTTAANPSMATTLPCSYTGSVPYLCEWPVAREASATISNIWDRKMLCASGRYCSALCSNASFGTVRGEKMRLPASCRGSLGCNQATGAHNRKQRWGFRHSGWQKKENIDGRQEVWLYEWAGDGGRVWYSERVTTLSLTS